MDFPTQNNWLGRQDCFLPIKVTQETLDKIIEDNLKNRIDKALGWAYHEGAGNPWIGAIPYPNPFEQPVFKWEDVIGPPVEEPTKQEAKTPDDKFGIGTEVMLSKRSVYWEEDSPMNPRNIKGEVVGEQKGKLPFIVSWSNGVRNSYSRGDLKYATR